MTAWTAARQASVFHHIPELAQTHVHWVSDAIQQYRSLSSPSPAFNLSQHQGFFPMSQLFASGGKSIGISASTSVLPVNIHDWFPLGLTGWIFLQSKGLSRVFKSISSKSIHSSVLTFFIVQLSHPYMTTGKTIASIRWTFVGKVMSLLFNKPHRGQ